MAGSRRSANGKGGTSANGDYLEKWLELRGRVPHLYASKNGIVDKNREPKPYTERFAANGGYAAVFTNQGIKPKSNPNPLNVRLGSGKIFEKCLVEDCRRPTGNMWGLCAGTVHVHEIVERRRVGGVYQRVSAKAPLERLDHFADWVGILEEASSGRQIFAPDHAGTTEVLMTWIGSDEARGGLIDDFVHDVLHNVVVGVVKDSTTLQLEFEAGADAPGDVIRSIERVVEHHLGDLDYKTYNVDWPRDAEGTFKAVPVKLVATMLALGFAAEEANRGDFWFYKRVVGAPERSHMASAYMSSVYYWLRRVGATPAQARMSLRA